MTPSPPSAAFASMAQSFADAIRSMVSLAAAFLGPVTIDVIADYAVDRLDITRVDIRRIDPDAIVTLNRLRIPYAREDVLKYLTDRNPR